LDIDATIELDAWAQIRKGFEPQTPAEKWLIDVDENDLMYVYRAYTGTCIFRVQFGPHDNGDGMTILEALANRDPEQYRNTKAGYDAKLLIYLIRRLLLKHDVPFPSPSTMPKINQGTHEQHVMGNESGINKRPGNSGFVPLNIVHSDNE
ncbi:MAG: hypothetical protein AAGD96_10895, partial [Chloroflexota bacterium]